MLPGVAPTHRKVSIPLVVVVNFEGDKVCPCSYQHICNHVQSWSALQREASTRFTNAPAYCTSGLLESCFAVG